MNKKFYFALALTAGLFASCSSDEVALAPQMNVDDSQKAPIELKLGSLSSVTRGTGTVGSLAGAAYAAENVWAGQKFNVYMFEKGTLTLAEDELHNPVYENQEFASPNILAGQDANTSAKVVAAAGTDIDGTNTVQDPNPDGLTLTEVNGYFPQSGNFDFWAYRLDGAATAAPALNAGGDAMVVPFTITGSEDIMVAKATPTEALNAADATHPEAFYTVGGTDIEESKVYSAYAARRGMHPHLNFQHLLSRLTFNVKSTKALSQQYADPTDETTIGAANGSAVRVTEIKVHAVASGELAVAYTTAPAEIITFTAGSEADLLLQQRAREVETPAVLAWSQDLKGLTMIGENATYQYTTGPQNEATTAALPVYQYNDAAHMGPDGMPDPTTNPASTLGTAAWPHIYAFKVETPTTYGKPDVAAGLVALDPVTPRWNSTLDEAYKTPVGESLLLAPAASYQIFITMEQDVPELTQVISWKDERNGTIYYFDTEADRDALVALYNAWKAAGYPAAGVAAADDYAAAAAGASTVKKEVVLKSTTKTTVTPLTLNGPKTVSLGVTTYKEFEANKSYNVNITLNGMESVSSDTEITGYEEGGDVDIEN